MFPFWEERQDQPQSRSLRVRIVVREGYVSKVLGDASVRTSGGHDEEGSLDAGLICQSPIAVGFRP